MSRESSSRPAEDAVETVLGLLPYGGALVPTAKRVTAAIVEERNRRVSVALRAAEELAGVPREDLDEALASDPRLVSLTIRLLHSAGLNGHDETLRQMGQVLGAAVADESARDDAEDCLRALQDLGKPHLEFLAYAKRSREEAEAEGLEAVRDPSRSWTEETKERDQRAELERISDRGWTLARAAVDLVVDQEVVEARLASLIAAGLVHTPMSHGLRWEGPPEYEISPLGRRLVEVAEIHRSARNP